MTGYPSIDKPWLKYYSEQAINALLPECSIYGYFLENNKDNPSDIAIIYLGRKITYGELFENIDATAAAFIKAGVKEKEIVTVALPSIPEAFIVLEHKVDENSFKNELKELCIKHLPDYMIPNEYKFIDEMPRTSRGKVDYRALEKMVEAEK